MAGRHLSFLRAALGAKLTPWRVLLAVVGLALALLSSVRVGTPPAGAADVSEKLPALCIDTDAVSVSGISSGAFFAHQFHVANSQRVMGAAIFAGGPYLCAGDDFGRSLFRSSSVCSHVNPGPFLGPPDAQRSIAAARAAAAAGGIDDLSGLRGDRVFLFSGRLDAFVPASVMEAVRTFYRAFDDAPDITFISEVDAAHAMVTSGFGNACDTSKPPFVNRCGYDLAGDALQHIYGALAPPEEAGGTIITFDQTEFVDPATTHGLAERDYAYVPKDCAEHRNCRLHVAFHGCQQNADTIGDAFYRHAGYNEWAEANDIVVLYPQAAAVTSRVAGSR